MIKTFQRLFRLLFISRILVKHGLDEMLFATHLFRPLSFLKYFTLWYWFGDKDNTSRGTRIRRSLEDLGPIFVKFGQILSTRRDLLPDDIADELANLQDNVPPFPSKQARDIIQKAYTQPLEAIFSEFEDTPLASASIAQVHNASLHNGTSVIIKVVRPNITRIIQRDISLLYVIAEKIERYWSQGQRLHPVAIVQEFEKNLMDELDLMREAANATQLRRNFMHSPLLYVPEVHWSYCRKNVMVMERINGMHLNDMESLHQAHIDMKKLAEAGVEIFFTQVFRDNFFHADMHPGNIFVSPTGQYIAIDFGIMGSLDSSDKRYLAENFLAFFNRDYYRVAELHIESGWVPPDTRINDFESAIRSVCEPIFEKPLNEISFGHLLLRLFQTARRFNMEVQPQLVLLQKTLLNIEGLGRQLYPKLDLWQTAKPFLEKWMKEQLGHRAFLSQLKHNIPLWMETLPELPIQLHKVLEKAHHGHLHMQTHSADTQQLQQQLHTNQRKSSALIFACTLLICATILYDKVELTTVLFIALLGIFINISIFISK